MIVKIEAPFKVSQEQDAQIKNALEKLVRYNNKMSQVNVNFKIGDGNLKDSVAADIEVHVPGPTVFASDSAKDFMDAFKGALIKMDRNLKRDKEIRQAKR